MFKTTRRDAIMKNKWQFRKLQRNMFIISGQFQ